MSETSGEVQQDQQGEGTHLHIVKDTKDESSIQSSEPPIDFLQKKTEKEARDKEALEQKQRELEAEQKRQADTLRQEHTRTNADAHVATFHNRAPVTAPESSYSNTVSFTAIEDSLKAYEADLERRRNLPQGEKGRISQATYERDLRRKRGEMYQRMIDQRVDGVTKRFGVDDLNALKVGNFQDLLQHAGKNEVFRNVLIKEIQHRVDQVQEDPMKAAEFKLQQVKKIYGAATSETPADGQVTKSWGERRVRGLRRQMAVDILRDEQNIPAVKEYIKNAEAYVKAEKARGNKDITEWPGGNLELAFHLRRIMAEQKRKTEKELRGDDRISDEARVKLEEEKKDLGLIDSDLNTDRLQREKEDLGIVDKAPSDATPHGKHETKITGMMDALGRYGSAITGDDISGEDLKREAELTADESDTSVTDKRDEEEDDDDGVPIPIPIPIGGDRRSSRRDFLGKAGKVAVGVGVGLGIDAVLSPDGAGAPGTEITSEPSEAVPHTRVMPDTEEPGTQDLPRRPDNPVNDMPPGGEGEQTGEPVPDGELKKEVEKWNIAEIKIGHDSYISEQERRDGIKDPQQFNQEMYDVHLKEKAAERMAAHLLIDLKDYNTAWADKGNSDRASAKQILEWAKDGEREPLKMRFDAVDEGQRYFVPTDPKTADEIYRYFKEIYDTEGEDALNETVAKMKTVLKERVREIKEGQGTQGSGSVEDIIKTFAPPQEQPKKKGKGLFSRWFGGKK